MKLEKYFKAIFDEMIYEEPKGNLSNFFFFCVIFMLASIVNPLFLSYYESHKTYELSISIFTFTLVWIITIGMVLHLFIDLRGIYVLPCLLFFVSGFMLLNKNVNIMGFMKVYCLAITLMGALHVFRHYRLKERDNEK
jgi:hypothetical protein